jgi:heat shock protein HslJ
MLRLRRRLACCLLVALAGFAGAALANDHTFPFDRELMLDAPPMPGTKRIPTLEIGANGGVSIDLWCGQLHGQANVGEDSISIVPGPANPAQCAPDRQSGDEKLLAALAQMTNWRRRGDIIELRGATTLRFHLMTN